MFAAGGPKLLGVGFLALMIFFVWGTYAVFTNKFVDFVPVTLKTSKIGLQLPMLADVKIRGVIVGEVREIESVGKQARLLLAIKPEKADVIPANATARIVPKTLFGEKYVALQIPSDASAESISAGDVIAQSDVAIEVERVLSDLYPLLRAVQPVDLNYTLTALATALEGRGESIGNNLVVLNDYLERTNPQIPELVEDLRLLSEVSDNYARVMPELARLLRNSVTTGNTFVEKEQKIEAFFNDVAGFSTTSRDFLQRNGENIIRLGELSVPQLNLYAKYAPEYPCLLKGMVRWAPSNAEAFRGNTLHINLEMLPQQPTGYSPADDPEYDAQNGPHCETLPNPPYSQANPGPQPEPGVVDDGVESGHGKHRPAPTFDVTSGYAGTAAEQSVVDAVAAPVMGVSSDEVPDVATLLFGPLARGTEVNLR
jgi:phospholipid/cholesterol/gamma-HCH transport system substrate-binding protein